MSEQETGNDLFPKYDRAKIEELLKKMIPEESAALLMTRLDTIKAACEEFAMDMHLLRRCEFLSKISDECAPEFEELREKLMEFFNCQYINGRLTVSFTVPQRSISLDELLDELGIDPEQKEEDQSDD